MHKDYHRIMIAILILATGLLAGCNRPTATPGTLPPCELDDLLAPRLIEPEDGAMVNAIESLAGPRPTFRWYHLGACQPGGFILIISSSPDLTPPYAYIEESEEWLDTWKLPVDLEVEQTYYWGVSVLIPGEGGGTGPFSETWSFDTTGVPEGQPGVISGMVWDDACPNPDPRDDYPADRDPPYGCIREASAIVADGSLGAHERGISDVVVRIAQGECVSPMPSDGVIASSGPTDEEGQYYYYAPVGTYCVYLDITEPENNAILMPGVLSAPNTFGPGMQTVSIESDGQIIEEISFGWDYDLDTGLEPAILTGGLINDIDHSGSYDNNEPGIPDVEVEIWRGQCPPAWEDRIPGVDLFTRTDQDGVFGADSSASDPAWMDIQPGEYCLMVDIEDESSQPAFERGYWTFPIEGQELPMIPIFLEPGTISRTLFGWHYPPYFIPEIAAHCRSGPDMVYETLSYTEEGQTYWLIGKNLAETWWQTESRCWVADSTGTMIGDPDELPVVNVPPPTKTPSPPTPTVTPSDNVFPLVESSAVSNSIPRGSENTINASAFDDVGVTNITIYIKAPGSSKFNPAAICSNSDVCSFTGTFDSSGVYEFYARASDAAGNSANGMTHSFHVYET